VTGLTGAGSSQTTALMLVANGSHEFTSVPSGSGAILPVPKQLPCEIIVSNADTNTLSVYPPVNGTVAGGSTNSAYSLAANVTATFWASSLLNYYLVGISSSSSGITALTGDVTASGTGSVAATVAKINGVTLGSTTATAGNVLIGSGTQWVTNPVSGDVTLGSTGTTFLFGQTGLISATLAASANNYSPAGWLSGGAIVANVIRLNVTASGVKLTGLAAATSGGLEGAVVTLQNALGSTNPLHIVANSGSSSAGNQFSFLSDVWLDPGESLELQYDNTQGNWREGTAHKNFQAELWGSGASSAGPATSTSFTAPQYFTDWTVPASQVYTFEGFDVFVNGTLDLSAASAGALVFNGGAGGAGSGASAGGAGAAGNGTNPTLPSSKAGGAGGAGTTTNGAGGAAAAAGTVYNITSAGAASGAGGAGSSGTAGALGAGGAASQAPIPYGFASGQYYNSSSAFTIPSAGIGGSGGGGGGGNGASNSGGGGGGGGASGGCIRIFARKIYRGSNATAGIIQAKGGVGGLGAAGVASGGGGGGGGGGGQGGVVLIYHSGLFGSAITGAIDVTAGSGGNGGALSGAGSNGVGGYAGPSGSVGITDMRTGVISWTGGTGRVANTTITGGPAATTQVNL